MATNDDGLPPWEMFSVPEADPGMPALSPQIAAMTVVPEVPEPPAAPRMPSAPKAPAPYDPKAPAAVRYNNPGAMYPGPSSRKYGSDRYEIIGGGHKIAVFPDAESGAAAQFDLLDRSYSGMRLSKAIEKWSGGNSSRDYTLTVASELGMHPGDKLTSEMLRDPDFAVRLAKSKSKWESGVEYPLDDNQWKSAHARAFGGGNMSGRMALGGPQVSDGSGDPNLSGGAGADALPPLPSGFTLDGGAAPAATPNANPFGVERRSQLYPGEETYFRQNPHVAGMAAEDGKVILNPYSKNAPHEQEAVALNEAARVYMKQGKASPTFSLTPTQKAQFKGTAYEANEQAMRETIAARILSGDPSAKDATAEQKRFVEAQLRPAMSPLPSGFNNDATPPWEMFKGVAPASAASDDVPPWEMFKVERPATGVMPTRKTEGPEPDWPETKPDGFFSGLWKAISTGTKQTGSSIKAAAGTYAGSADTVVDAAKYSQSIKRDDPVALTKFNERIEAKKNEYGDTFVSGIKNVASAAYDNPKGVLEFVVQQAPNTVAALAPALAGAGIGSFAGPLGTTAGFLVGLFGGNTLLETGGKAQEKAGDGTFTDEERKETMKEGAVKGGVITGVDAVTLGTSRYWFGATSRAVEKATAKVLADNGIDAVEAAAKIKLAQAAAISATKGLPKDQAVKIIGDSTVDAMREMGLANDAIIFAVKEAQENALKLSNSVAKRAGRLGGAVALETGGETVGEYLGELAATGQSKPTDAIMEGIAGLTMSITEAGAAKKMAADNPGQLTKGFNAAGSGATPSPATPTAPQPAPAQPSAASSVPSAIPQATAEEAAVLRSGMGYSQPDIDGMTRAEIDAELADAASKGLQVPARAAVQPPADEPTAEPIADLAAQISDLRSGARQGVYLSPDNVANVKSNPAFVDTLSKALAEAKGSEVVENVDGKGGVLVAKDKATADAVKFAMANGADPQKVLGAVTGAGTGKAANADTVVQQRTPEGAVTRETVVPAAEAPAAAEALAAPGRSVETMPAADAVKRREDGIAAEKEQTIKLYRGTKAGVDPRDKANTTGNALFYAPDRSVAEAYAGKDGTIIEDEITFKNLLTAPNWHAAAKMLGSDRPLPMNELIEAARKAGHDGITFKTKWGDEYIQIPQAPAPTGDGSRKAPVKVEIPEDVTAAAKAAAADYTPAQGEANNRKLGHAKWEGLDISIETEAGGVRKGVDKKTGQTWETTMGAAYGYIKGGATSADGMALDVYMGTDPASGRVWVIDEVDRNDPSKFRQHKAMLAFPDEESAIAAYTGTSSKSAETIGAVTEMPVQQFRAWARDGKKTKPLGQIGKPEAKPKKKAAPKAPETALSFIRNAGGIAPDADLRQIADGVRIPGLFNKNGVSPDDMLRLLESESYIQDRSGPNQTIDTSLQDLYDLVGKIVNGERVGRYGTTVERPMSKKDVAAENRRQILGEVESIFYENGWTNRLTEADEDKLVDLVGNQYMDIGDALEQIAVEAENEAAITEGTAAEGQQPGVSGEEGVEPSKEGAAGDVQQDPELASRPEDGAKEPTAEVTQAPETGPSDSGLGRIPTFADAKALFDGSITEIRAYLDEKGWAGWAKLSDEQRSRAYNDLKKMQGETAVEPLVPGEPLAAEPEVEAPVSTGPKDRGPDRLKDYTGITIDGYVNQEVGNEERDGSLKRGFLSDARDYLTKISKILKERGFEAHTDTRGKKPKPGRAVSVNPSGPAGSGDVSLTVADGDGKGIYVQIGTPLAGPKGGISLMARRATKEDKFGAKGQNQWLSVDLPVAEMADKLERIARGSVTKAEPAESDVDMGAVHKWWRNELTPAGRTLAAKDAGLKKDVAKIAWQYLTDADKAALARAYAEKYQPKTEAAVSDKPAEAERPQVKPGEPEWDFIPNANWRDHLIRARVYAAALRIPFKDLDVEGIVAAIDKKMAEHVGAPEGVSLTISDTILDGEDARIKGGQYKAVAQRKSPWSSVDGYGANPLEAATNAVRKLLPARVDLDNGYGHYVGQKVVVVDRLGNKSFDGVVEGAAKNGDVRVRNPQGNTILVDNPMRVVDAAEYAPGGQTSLVPEATTGEKIKAAEKEKSDKGKAASDDAGPLFNPDAGKQGDLVDLAKKPVEAEKPADTYNGPRNEWVERPGQRDMVLKLDGDGEVAGSVMYDATRQKRNRDEAWAALDADGKVIGYGPTMGDAKDIVDGKSAGQRAYESDVRARPKYDDGSARKTWAQLGEVERGSWEKNPTQREPAKQPDSPKPSPVVKDEKEADGKADTSAWLAERETRIKESKAAGNKHLDGLDRSVEGMRGVKFYNAHDPKERGTVRTVANTGEVVVNWADKYSADKNLVDEQTKDGKAMVWQSWLAPTDLKDYVVESAANTDPLAPLVVVLRGAGFKTIIEARKFVKEAGILPADATNKQIDETVEAAVVAAARQIVAEGKTPAATFNALTTLYGNQPNLASRTGTSVANQAYSTPMPLAYVASRLAGVKAAAEVYEPTAGNGALLIEADPAKTYANEIDPDRAASLKMQGFTVTSKDGAEVPSLTDIDSVIMNPPFGAVKEGGASKVFALGDLTTTKIDHAISLNALEAMADDGKAVLIIGGTKAEDVKERTQSYRGLNMKDAKTGKGKDNFYRVLYDRYNVTDHFTVSGDLYTKQGASWPVDVIVIEGRGKSQRPLPGTPQGVPALLKSWDALAEKIPNDTANDRTGDRPARKPVAPVERPARTDAVGVEPDGGVVAQPGAAGAGTKPASVRAGSDRGQPGDGGAPQVDQGGASTGVRGDTGGTRGDAPAQRERQRVKVDTTKPQVPYQPTSNNRPVDTLIPTNQAAAVEGALAAVQSEHGAVDVYVAEKLGYEPKSEEFADAFSGEQVDTLALAIANVERGSALIVGSQTGIGKGRVAAGMLRYAIKNGMTPVFITEKPDLYGDMYRDMRDIGLPKMLGRDVRIFATNAATSVPMDEDAVDWVADKETADEAGEKAPKRTGRFLPSIDNAKKNAEMQRIMSGEDIADVIFTTYSQMQPLGEDKPAPLRHGFLKAIAPNAMVIMDESHNASGGDVKDEGAFMAQARKKGGPTRAEFSRDIAGIAKGVMFSSATWAKRPDSMILYARAMPGAVEDINKLPGLIKKGGVPLQQIISQDLAKQNYIRHERSFEGITYAVKPVEISAEAYSQFVTSVKKIFQFDLAVADVRKDVGEDILADIGAGTQAMDGGVGEASATSTGFSSIMHNIVSQMLLAIKAGPAAKEAIAAHKRGEKPIITLANTNESFIRDFANAEGISIGDTVDMNFGHMLKRYLSRTLRITVKKPGDKKPTYIQIPISRLSPDLQQMYQAVEYLIEQGNYDAIPLSPIDAIRHELKKAGMSVREITGRSTMLEYADGRPPKYVTRPKKELGAGGKRVTVKQFNSGDLDAIIFNKSGSTGVSMHAKFDFKDRRKRHMIVVQADSEINTHLQTLGRAHRTGQVTLPTFTHIAADIPAEKRPLAVLMGKMASLNANTTGATGSAFTVEGADFLNEVGDSVMASYLSEHPGVNRALGNPFRVPETGSPNIVDLAKKATGKLVLLDIAEQEAFLNGVQEAYKNRIAELNALGENPLEAKSLDLQARVLETTELVAKVGEGPFGAPVIIEKISAKAQGRAMEPKEVAERLVDFLKVTPQATDPAARIAALEQPGRAWAEKKIAELSPSVSGQIETEVSETVDEGAKERTRDRLTKQASRWKTLMRYAYPGARITLNLPEGDVDGIVVDVERSGTAKQSAALGSWHVKVAVASPDRLFHFSMASLFMEGEVKGDDERGFVASRGRMSHADLLATFEASRKEGRENRYVVTGNILKGYEQVGGWGQVVNFTDDRGDVRSGVLTKRGFDPVKFMAQRKLRFPNGATVAEFLEKVSDVNVTGTEANIVLGRNRRGFYIQIDRARRTGGKFYTDKAVRTAIAPSEFESRGTNMLADGLSRDKFVAAVDEMKKIGAAFETNTAQDEAQAIIGASVEPTAMRSVSDVKRRLDGVKTLIKMGRTVDLSRDAEPLLKHIRDNPSIVPSSAQEVVITKMTPVKGEKGVYTITAKTADGTEINYEDDGLTAVRSEGLFAIVAGRPIVALSPLDLSGNLIEVMRRVRAHEGAHALRALGLLSGSSSDPTSIWGRLVGHADNLGVLGMTRKELYQRLKDPRAATADSEVTTLEVYHEVYKGDRDKLEDESVAHLTELYVGGGLSEQEAAPVKDIFDDMLAGRLPENADAELMQAVMRSVGETDASIGQSMRRSLDSLGFYSKALEAAEGLKQAKGTPEQMLAQLKKAGVKDAEIEATGLDKLLRSAPVPSPAFWKMVKPMDAKLSGDAARAMDEWVGGGVDTVERGLTGGLMMPDRLESMSDAALDAMAAPVRGMLRDAHGSTITVYRGEQTGASQSTGRKNRLASYTTNRKVAEAFSGAGQESSIISEDMIAKAERDYAATGEAKVGRFWFKRDDEYDAINMLDRGGGVITDTDSIRGTIEDSNADATSRNNERSKALAGVTEVRLPVDAVVWATDRFNQKEIIAKRGSEMPALDGKKSVTKSEIVSHLEGNRVGLKEVQYSPIDREAVREESAMAHFGVRYDDLSFEDRETISDSLRNYDPRAAKFSNYSLDPSNPTYRETVLHLPGSADNYEAPYKALYAEKLAFDDKSNAQGGRLSGDDADRIRQIERELADMRDAMKRGKAADFRSGHFTDEPNIIGHMMTSLVRHEGKPVFLIDQIQSDWGQRLRDGGVRDEAKVAELKERMEAAKAAASAHMDTGPAILGGRIDTSNPTSLSSMIVAIKQKAAGTLERTGDPVAFQWRKTHEDLQNKYNLALAELRTAEAATPGNPLVNTTDQWVNITLRRAIRQAAEADADYIAIPHGDTVLSYNPGDAAGMRGFYGSRTSEGIVPKNARKLLERMDGSIKPAKVEALDTPTDTRGYRPNSREEFDKAGTGFTLFPLTDAVKASVKTEGQPLFSNIPRADMSPEARKARAEEMGFDTSRVWYHVTDSDFDQFSNDVLGSETARSADSEAALESARLGTWFTTEPMRVGDMTVSNTDGGRTIPTYVRGNFYDKDGSIDLEYVIDVLQKRLDKRGEGAADRWRNDLIKRGYDGIRVVDTEFGGESLIVFDPKNIRSVNADFDPAQSDSPQIMASGSPGKSEKAAKDTEKAIADALEITNRIAGPSASVQMDKRIVWSMAGETAGGTHTKTGDARALIRLAYADPKFDIRTTAGHEAYHHVEEVLATAQEMKLLRSPSEMARAEQHAVAEIGRDAVDRLKREGKGFEIRTYAFQRYRRLREEGMTMSPLHIGVRRFWDRLIRTFHNVKNALKGKGYDSMESIFERARTGEMVVRAAEMQRSLSVAEIEAQDDRNAAMFRDNAIARPDFELRGFSGKRSAKARSGGVQYEIFDGETRVGELLIDPPRRLQPSPMDMLLNTSSNERFFVEQPFAGTVLRVEVDPAHQGKGLASALLDVAEADLKAVGAELRPGDTSMTDDFLRLYAKRDSEAMLDSLKRQGVGRWDDLRMRWESAQYDRRQTKAAQRVGAQEADQGAQAAGLDRAIALARASGATRIETIGPNDPHPGPVVAYHGTANDFDRFDLDKTADFGVHFGTPEQADWRVSIVDAQSRGRIIPAVLDLRNVITVPDLGNWKTVELAEAVETARPDLRGIAAEVKSIRADGNAYVGDEKRYLRQRLTDAGIDGIRYLNQAEGEGWSYIVWEKGRVASATSGETLLSIFPTATSSGTRLGRKIARQMRRITPSQEKSDDFRRIAQDRMIKLRRKLESIENRNGIPLAEQFDTYVEETLMHGRMGVKLARDLGLGLVEPLMDHLNKNGISLGDIDDYMAARHVEERNRVVGNKHSPGSDFHKAITDKSIVGASGWSQNKADAVLAKVSSSPKAAAYAEAADMIDAIKDFTNEELLAAGNITQAEYQERTTVYQYYVPLRGFETDIDDGSHQSGGTGRGIDIRGPEARQAFGRRSKSDSPLGYTLLQAQQAVIRSAKNQVGKSMYRLVKNNPDPSWEIFKGESRQRTNPTTGMVETYWVRPPFIRDDQVFGVKRSGKQYWIKLEPDLARAMRGVQFSDMESAIVAAMSPAINFYKKLLTSWNPAFQIPNFTRDLLGALINLAEFEALAPGIRKKVLKDALSLKAIRSIMRHEGVYYQSAAKKERAAIKTDFDAMKKSGLYKDDVAILTAMEKNHGLAGWFEEYSRNGGQISFLDRNDIASIKRNLESAITEGNVRRKLRLIGRGVDNLSSAVENGVRLSAYIELRKNGVSIQKSASIARELTVNFNRKGEWGAFMNVWWLFYNAGVQGTVRMIQGIVRSPAVQRSVVGLAGMGLALDVMNYLIAGDDEDDGESLYDKIPAHIKDRNIVIMWGKGRDDYFKIPLPYGFNTIYVAGQLTGEMGRKAAGLGAIKSTPAGSAQRLSSAMMDAFNPLGTSPFTSWIQMVSPTLLDPAVQIVENKNWMGIPIFPTKYDKMKPDSESYFASVNPLFIDLAKALNRMGGGNSRRSGSILGVDTDFSPEVLEHWAQFMGGGLGKELLRGWEAGARFTAGEEFLPEKTPIINRFYGKRTHATRVGEFWKEWTENVAPAHAEVTGLAKDGDYAGSKAAREKYPAELRAYGVMKSTQKALSTFNKERRNIKLNREMADDVKKVKLKDLEDRENKLIIRALEVYARAKKAADAK